MAVVQALKGDTFMRLTRSLVAVAAIACAAGATQAQTIEFWDDTALRATLTWSGTTDFTLTFLSAPDANAYVDQLYFQGPSGTFVDTDTTTLSSATFCPAGCNIAGTDYNWEVQFPNGNNADRLVLGEVATFSITGTTAADFGTPAGIHLNAFINDQSIRLEGCVSNCGPVPGIPEPETYALMLAGLGVIGYMARRRKGPAA
jgi:hypothetical protein